MSALSGVGEIASSVQLGQASCSSLVRDCLQRIERKNPELNCITSVMPERALSKATQLDEAIARGENPGPLAGVPFSVKNLFDVRGEITLAGSLINRENAPAKADAVLIQRLESAGAILTGSLNMGEYAYDFTGENIHYGNCLNPWDTQRMSGGSSSGSGTAVAAGLTPFSLGSDTNGSIRVPASFCGIFGLKPTYGRLPRSGTFPFSDSLDHLGPLARSSRDLALVYDLMQGWHPDDPACSNRSTSPVMNSLEEGIVGLRVARADGYFNCADFPQAEDAVSRICEALGTKTRLELDGAAEGRASAYIITNAEGATLHKENIKKRINDFDPDTRDRFLAGCLLPAEWYLRAQAVRRWWLDSMLHVFTKTDLIVAPATPCAAPKTGTKYLEVRGGKQLLRPNLGLFTQPFSAIGLPVVTVPVWSERYELPIGVQLIAAPWREDLIMRAAHYLESVGACQCRIPEPYLT